MSHDPMIYGDVLLTIRICIHLATLGVLLGYSSEHRTKWFSTLLAFLLAGTSFAMAVQSLIRFSIYGPTTEIWSVLFFGVVLILISYSGGNIARVLYQDRRWFTR
jgi:ABC-type iron transport system FetAB permease component